MTQLEQADRYERMNKVVELHLQGLNETQVAKNLGMKRTEVVAYVREFKEIAKSNEVLRERMLEVPHEYDTSIRRVLREMWRTADDAQAAGDLKTRATVLKNIGDTEAKKVEVLQKSGLLSDSQVADEMAEMEEKHEIIMGILREVSLHCPNCKREVAKRLAKATGQPEPMYEATVVSE